MIPVLPARGLQPVCVHADPAPPTPLPLRESSEPRLGPRSRSPSASAFRRVGRCGRGPRSKRAVGSRGGRRWLAYHGDDFFHGPGVGGGVAGSRSEVFDRAHRLVAGGHGYRAQSRLSSRLSLLPYTTSRPLAAQSDHAADESARDCSGRQASVLATHPLAIPVRRELAMGSDVTRSERRACSWQHPWQHPDRPLRPFRPEPRTHRTLWTHRTDLTGGLQG